MCNTSIKRGMKSILLLMVLICLTGCSIKKVKNDSDVEEFSNIETEDEGVYSRTLVEIPKGECPLYISKANSKELYVVTGNDNISEKLWSVDKNDNWKIEYDFTELLDMDKKMYCNAYVSPEGEVLGQYNKEIEREEENPFAKGKLEYFFVDKSGKKNEINLELPTLKSNSEHDGGKETINHIIKVKFIDNNIYLVDANSNIFELDKSNYNLKCVFDNQDFGYIDDFCIYDKTLIIWSDEMICYEGLETHDNEEKIYNKFKSFFEASKQINKSIHTDVDSEGMWTLCEDKIGKYDFDKDSYSIIKVVGTKRDEVIETSMAKEGKIYALVGTYENQQLQLYRYAKNEDNDDVSTISDANSGKLKIWVLNSSDICNEAVRCFTDKYPNIEIEVECGLENADSSITPVDAIKNLNAEIVSGNSPDIIYMDGLNINKYIDAGELYDISELINELKASGDYFDNIIETFNKDGKIYTVPSSVFLIGKVGTKEDIAASEDIVKFAEYIKTKNNDHRVISDINIPPYVVYMYYRDIQKLIISGDIDKEKLEEFFEATKELYDVAGNKDYTLYPPYMLIPGGTAMGYNGEYDFKISNMADVTVGPLADKMMADKINGEVDYPASDYKDSYAVSGCMAISSNSTNLDIAKEYIKVALGEECQSGLNGAVAFRVNRKALVNSNEYNYSLMAEAIDGTDTGKADFDGYLQDTIKCMENVNKPICVDWVFDQMVFDELNNYIQGNTELDTAVDNILQKSKLYLEE